MVFNENQIEYAEHLYRAGFELLPAKDCSDYRATAAQGIALCRDLQGDLQGALYFLGEAVSESPSTYRRFHAHLLFTAANLERRLRRFDDAESKYWTALKIFSQFNDVDAAVRLCIDLSVCLIQSGQRQRLAAVVAAVKEQLPKLRNRRALQHQCELLLRELSREDVELQQLAKLAETVESARPPR